MDNHVHMLIEVAEAELPKIMQGVQQVYTQHYNKKKLRTGHVFQQRYKAVVCNKDGYLLHLIKYIHYNSIKASLEGGINYKWSSHREYIQSEDKFADVKDVLKILSKNKKQALKGYMEYMKEEINDIEENEYEVIEAQRCKLKLKKNLITIEKLIKKIIEQEGITEEEISQKTKKQKIADIRKAIIKLSESNCEISNKQLADELGVDNTLISKVKNDEARMNENAQEIIDKFNSLSICQA